MTRQKRRSSFALESLEERVALSGLVGHPGAGTNHLHQAAVASVHGSNRMPTVGTLGDSYTDEYRFYPPDQSQARNWVEILSDTHRANFGAFSTKTRGEPRDQGFAFNWARYGATSNDMIANQLPGLASQVSAGKIQYAWIFIGGNDFLYFLQGAQSVNATNLPAFEAQLGQLASKTEANFKEAVGTLLAANPNVRLVVSTIPNVALLPAVSLGAAGNPAAQALVAASSQALEQYNALIRSTAAGNPRIALVDLAAAANNLVVAGSSGTGAVPFGGTTIQVTTPGDNFHDFFLADGIHVGTVGQGIIADTFVQAVDQTFGAKIAPLTDTAIVNFARHVRPSVP